jgi:hypothetical protein
MHTGTHTKRNNRNFLLSPKHTPSHIVNSFNSFFTLHYSEAQDLEDWRDELIDEVKAKTAALRAVPGSDLTLYSQIIEVLGGHFTVVLQLSQEIRNAIKNAITTCIILAQENPSLLVRSFEVMIMIENNARKKKEEVFARGDDASEEEIVMASLVESFEGECLKVMKDAFNINIQSQYANFMFAAADEGKSGIEATLGAAAHGQYFLELVQNVVAPCCPPQLNVITIYRQQFEEYIAPQVAAQYSQNVESLDIGDLLRLVSWMTQYNDQVVEIGAGEKNLEFEDAILNLMAEYKFRVCAQLRESFNRINNNEDEDQLIKTESNTGQKLTSHPEDMLFQCQMQITVANYVSIPSVHLVTTVQACIDVLGEVKNEYQGACRSFFDPVSFGLLFSKLHQFSHLSCLL